MHDDDFIGILLGMGFTVVVVIFFLPEFLKSLVKFLINECLVWIICIAVVLVVLVVLFNRWCDPHGIGKKNKVARKYGVALGRYDITFIKRRFFSSDASLGYIVRVSPVEGVLYLYGFELGFYYVWEMREYVGDLRRAGVSIPKGEWEIAADELCEILDIQEIPREVVFVIRKDDRDASGIEYWTGGYSFCRHCYQVREYLVYVEWKKMYEEQNTRQLERIGIRMADRLPEDD